MLMRDTGNKQLGKCLFSNFYNVYFDKLTLMNWLRFLFPLLFTSFCFNASAISAPASSSAVICMGDTTTAAHNVSFPVPVKEKKGLLQQLKEKVAVFLLKHTHRSQATGKKKTLALVSIALLLLGLVLCAATGSLLPWLLVAAGLVTGIRALSGKKQTEIATAPKKKSWFGRNLGWFIPVFLLIGGLTALFIAFGSMSFH